MTILCDVAYRVRLFAVGCVLAAILSISSVTLAVDTKATLDDEQKDSIAHLRFLEGKSAQIKKDISNLEKRITQENNTLTQLYDDNSVLRQELRTEEEQVAVLLRQAYLAGPISKVRLWLRPSALHTRDRLIEYHRIVLQERRGVIERYNRKLQERDVIHAQQATLVDGLVRLRAEQNHKQDSLETATRQTQATIVRIRAQRKQLYRQLSRYRASKTLLSIPFEQMRGALISPIEGRIQNRFGDKHPGGLVWHGWEIKARQPQDVHAVHDGTVLFMQSNHLMGLLIVIDHGDNYLSLYAHNHSALKQVGDTVRRGESIATVKEASILYFGLLREGMPLDPEPWLQS